MPHFRIEGVEDVTGKRRRIEIEADSEALAIAAARDQGVRPSRVVVFEPWVAPEPRHTSESLPPGSLARFIALSIAGIFLLAGFALLREGHTTDGLLCWVLMLLLEISSKTPRPPDHPQPR